MHFVMLQFKKLMRYFFRKIKNFEENVEFGHFLNSDVKI